MHSVKSWGKMDKSTEPASISPKLILTQVMMSEEAFICSFIRIQPPKPNFALKRKIFILDELFNKVINLSLLQNKGYFLKK